MLETVQCAVHGEQERTTVCQHIVRSLDTQQAVGFHWPAETTQNRPDAWCHECHQVMLAEGGEWTEEAMAFVQVQVLCGSCYDRAKSIWLTASQIPPTKH